MDDPEEVVVLEALLVEEEEEEDDPLETLAAEIRLAPAEVYVPMEVFR